MTSVAAAPEPKRPYIGGQAVLEGVMMRAPKSFAIVVRRRDGSLLVRERGMTDDRRGLARLPFVRGVVSLVESLRLGSEALRFSAEQFEKDLVAEEAANARAKKDAAAAPANAKSAPASAKASGAKGLSVLTALGLSVFAMATKDDASEPALDPAGAPAGTPEPPAEPPEPAEPPKKSSSLTMLFMLAVVVVFFIALPQGAAEGLTRLLKLDLSVQSAGFQAITGVFKLAIVVGYLLAIRRVPDIRRVFQYHGAEHKTISTYEADEELTVANARAKTTLHPRCGTTFLVMVALVSILVFTAIGSFLPRLDTGNRFASNVVFFLEKLPFLPVIAAVTFELQRVFARYCTTGPLRALLWPGFLVQKITTIEPDDSQLEVALASLRATLFRQEGGEPERSAGKGKDEDVSFPTYAALLGAERLRQEAA